MSLLKQAAHLEHFLAMESCAWCFNGSYLQHGRIGVTIGWLISGALQWNHMVQHVTMKDVFLLAEGTQAMAEMLRVNSTLQTLELPWCSVKDRGAIALGEALQFNSTLQHLQLHMDGILVRGAAALATSLKVNHSLLRLDLAGNSIGDVGAQVLAEALEVNPTLQHLALASNNIGDVGIRAFSEALKVNSAITYLDLSCGRSFAETLRMNTTLKSLSLRGNKIGVAANAMAKALQENRTLQQIDLTDSNVDTNVLAFISEMLVVNLQGKEHREEAGLDVKSAERLEDEIQLAVVGNMSPAASLRASLAAPPENRKHEGASAKRKRLNTAEPEPTETRKKGRS
eukprot:GGOE01004055.1.p1 GENE.GGOE01004055.1~~GGOE01004055.1.p1  ORF type:complete len:342 (+),score=57.64 GGOE01004055.1:185-1210(+)